MIPGALSRILKLTVMLCMLHISILIVFYVGFWKDKLNFNHHESHPDVFRWNKASSNLQKCPETSMLLKGPLTVDFNVSVSLEEVKNENPNVTIGGRFRPKECAALQKVAVIIPFRNRHEHLKYWLYYLHPILQRQQLDYGVYVINQDGDGVFNKARLMNSGFLEALKEDNYECFVFNDVDIVPMDDRNLYKCFSQPRHLAVLVDKFNFKLPYYELIGGITAMSKEQFLMINGFSNSYWGWGGEDDDLYSRVITKGMNISRPEGELGKCRMIHHERDKDNQENKDRYHSLNHTMDTMDKDGINTLSYKVVKIEKHDLFTNITVNVGRPWVFL